VTAGVLLCVIFTDPVASMMMLPPEDVLTAVLVALEIVVSARAESTAKETVSAAVSRAAAAAESIKRCLINSAS
jgi:hypothetical protein